MWLVSAYQLLLGCFPPILSWGYFSLTVLATLSLITGLLGIAGALLIWGTQLGKTGLVGDFYFLTFAHIWNNFWHLVAWWALSLVCPLLTVMSGHDALNLVEERQEGVTTGRTSAVVGLSLGYLVLILSTGTLLVSLLINYVTSLTG